MDKTRPLLFGRCLKSVDLTHIFQGCPTVTGARIYAYEYSSVIEAILEKIG